MARVVGKRPLDKGGNGGGTGAFGRGSQGGEYHGKELGASGRREFTVETLLGEVAGERVLPALQGGGVLRWVWLLGKLRQGAPGVSGRKKVAPGRNEPGRKHPELVFTLQAPGTSVGKGQQHATGRRPVFLLML